MGDTKNLSEDNGADKFNLGSGEANQATTSKLSVNPEENSHNMNDLKALDFNSADEVRQTMKAVLSCKEPYNTAEENISQRIVGNVEKKVNNDKKPVEVEIANKEQINNLIKTEPKENICVLVNPKTEIWSSNDCNVKKRPGRPPKAGTSKKKLFIGESVSYFSNLLADRIISEIEFPIGSRCSVLQDQQQ
ncbi:unnamed protein product [Diatraea saccharalis]|uniref:Uncharacterized protein n=1 Tax=Diatraea saccharalis TaxID=40085 RepID=A0A9N9WD58_9NEOP|nr:unnamed protein product [Diatraea saccharalis]